MGKGCLPFERQMFAAAAVTFWLECLVSSAAERGLVLFTSEGVSLPEYAKLHLSSCLPCLPVLPWLPVLPCWFLSGLLGGNPSYSIDLVL